MYAVLASAVQFGKLFGKKLYWQEFELERKRHCLTLKRRSKSNQKYSIKEDKTTDGGWVDFVQQFDYYRI